VAILAGILIIYIAVVFGFQYVLLQRQIFHDEIQDVETVEGLLYFDGQGKLHLQENYHSHPQSRLLEDRLMEVRDLSGIVLYRSATLHGEPFGGASFPDEGASSFNPRSTKLSDGTRVLLISHLHPIQDKLVLIRLGYSMAPLNDRMLHFFLILLFATPIGLVAAGFAGYRIARRALLPLDLMAARAELITASNLQDRIVIENPHDELGHMGRVLNHLLQRLEQAFLQLQRFTADAAHELRTPSPHSVPLAKSHCRKGAPKRDIESRSETCSRRPFGSIKQLTAFFCSPRQRQHNLKAQTPHSFWPS
jgi:signal transduction histidine kinase